MKKVLAWVLLLATVLSLFAGCKKTETPETTAAPSSGVTAQQAIEYLKAVYPTSREAIKTAVDYERMAVVRINDIPLEVVWTADVAEDLVKIVPNDNGTVTIDVKEQSETEVNYTLTATVTDDAGGTASYSWKYMLPAYVFVDMAAVVEEAYKLKDGQSMDYAVTLTGKITRVKEVYNPDFKNITVVIEIEGAEDKPITCYRMKGDGADKLKVGDIITVTGVITNYKGTIEFEAGCTLDAYIEGEGVEAPEDVGQILKEAYALAQEKSLPYEVTLTGKITKINTPYDKGYKNVSVTIVVEGYEKYPILCYRIKGNGADNLFIGDTITVRGYICNYKGTIEFEAGSILEKVEKTGKEIKAPSDVKQILKEAYALKENDTLPYEATLTGVITKVNTEYSAQYQNVTVTIIVDGISEYPIKCYRMKGNGANKIGKGDTITVTGWITNYKGTIEFAAGCTLDKWKDTGTDTPDVDIFIPTLVPELVENPVPGTAYKFYVEQKNIKKTLYLTGKMDGYYFETTEDPEKAADVYLEKVSGGYRAYVMNSGRKNYMEIVKKGDYTNVVFTTSPSKTLKWNDTIKSVTCDVNGEAFYFGTYKEFETFSASNISYVTGEKADAFDVTNFVGHFATLKESEDAKKTPGELVINALKAEYMEEGKVYSTAENFNLQSVFDIKGNKVNVTWTVDNKAVSVVDNKNGTVTVKVTRGDTDIFYNLTATIKEGDKTYTATGKYKIPAKAATGASAIVNAAYALQPGEALPDEYTLTGVIIGTDTPYSDQYKNVSVVIVVDGMSDKPILCYRLKGDGAEQLGKGDTVTVTGYLKNYNGIIEFDTGCVLDSWKNTGSEAPATAPDIDLKPSTPGDDDDDDDITTNLVPEIVDAPAVGTAYKFVVNQKNLGKNLYITGEMDGYYFATTADPAEAADVYLEQVSGGYRVYVLKSGVKNYLEIVKSGTHNNVVFTTSPTKVLKWNADIKSVTCDVEGEDYYFGTYNSYKTFSASQASRVTGDNASALDTTNFVAHFATLAEGTETPTEPTTPTQPSEPGVVPEIVTSPVAGTAYKFMVDQKLVGKVLYLTGEMSGYYFETTENADEAADVYLEQVSGGYRVYVLKSGVKNYMEIVQNGTYTNVVFTTSPTKVLKWNDEIKSVTCDVDGTDYYFGSYKTYVTFSASKISYVTGENASTFDVTNFVGHFATLAEGETPTESTEPSTEPTTEPTEPSTEPTEPSTEPTTPSGSDEYITAPVVGTAYKLRVNQKLAGKTLYLTGEMNGYYYGTTEDAAAAVDVYFEEAEGGYRVYFLKDNEKNYLEIIQNGTYTNVVFTTSPTKVLKWNDEIKSVTCDVDGTDYYFGSYRTYETLSASKISYVTGENASTLDETNFVAHFYEVGGETPTEPTDPSTEPTDPSTEPTDPSTEPTDPSTEPTAPSVSEEYATAPVVGTAYKMRVNQKLAGKTLYLTGEMDGYYYGTTESVDEAVDVYFEEAEGGYRLYFLKDNEKNYLEIVQNGNYTNVVFTTSPTKVLKWNDEIKSVTCDVDGTDYYFGSYRTYETFSASKISYVTGENASTLDETNFVSHFYEVISAPVDPTDPTDPSTEPTDPSTEPTDPSTEPSAPAENGYIKVTAADQLVSGQYVLVVGTGYAPKAVDGTWLSAAQPVVSGSKVTDTQGAVWTLNVTDAGVSLKDANGVFVGPKGGNNNGITTGTEYFWAVTFADGAFRFAGTGSDTVLLSSNVQYENKFRGYKSTTVAGNADGYPCDFALYVLTGEGTPAEPTDPSTEATEPSTEATTAVEIVTDPVPGTAYKFMLTQKNLGKQLYLTGKMDGYYYGTTEEYGTAADVYLETVEGGYRFYVLVSGVKNYMEIVKNGTYNNVVFTTEPTKVLKWNAGINSLTCDVEGEDYYFGTYNTYKTFSASSVSRITGENAATMDETNFVGHFVTMDTGNTGATEPGVTDPTTTEVNYKYGSAEGYSDVILNWGKRGAAATFLSPNAETFYSENGLTYAGLSALAGSDNLSNVASSALYTKLQEVMTNAQDKETTYGDTRYLFCFTDCQESSSSTITCFYSGTSMNSAWDSGATYNREHCWPKSKTESGTATNSTAGINGDIMTLRPAKSNLNSSRGNKGYGTSVNFYNPNSSANGQYDLRGDVARLVLYTYVRWGNTHYMWGEEGVMESKDILLDWIAADPVDTWELGRNDSVESITGTRNVFVDYPELAYILFGDDVPQMTTPSGNAA